MSGIQSLLAIGAVWLFALVTINFNTTVVHNISIEVENKVYLDAFSLADDMIEEIKQKTFEDTTGTWDYPKIEDDLQTIYTEEGNNRDLFDDIDDYNGFIEVVGLPYVENFRRTVSVKFANPNDFSDTTFSSKSYYKRVDVKVESIENYLTNPVHLSFIFALHSR
jgi:hypothetical protein